MADPKWNRSHAEFVAVARRRKNRMRRFTIAARLIPPGSRVLDLGCGSMLLRSFLPPDCTYVPADLFADRHHEIIQVDLNKGEFPDGQFDVVVLLAVLGVVTDPLAVLRTARQHSKLLIATSHGSQSSQGFREMLANAGWTVDRRIGHVRIKRWRLVRGATWLCR